MEKYSYIILFILLFSTNVSSGEEQKSKPSEKNYSQEQQSDFEKKALKEKEKIIKDKQKDKSRDYGDPCNLNPGLPVCP